MDEQFRHHAGKLKIVSFYETLTTTVGPVKTLILEKQSSVAGCQHETPQPLVANHHDVCKFNSPKDPNYQSVKCALRSIVDSVRCSNEHQCEGYHELSTLGKWLSVPGTPADDLAGVRASRKPGTDHTRQSRPCWLLRPFRRLMQMQTSLASATDGPLVSDCVWSTLEWWLVPYSAPLA